MKTPVLLLVFVGVALAGCAGFLYAIPDWAPTIRDTVCSGSLILEVYDLDGDVYNGYELLVWRDAVSGQPLAIFRFGDGANGRFLGALIRGQEYKSPAEIMARYRTPCDLLGDA
jgi:hypothetical protein